MKKITILWLDDEMDPELYLKKKKSNSDAFLRTYDFYMNKMFCKYYVDFIWCKTCCRKEKLCS